MKEIKQPNIVNFLDSYLVGESELWVSVVLKSDWLLLCYHGNPSGCNGISCWRITY